MATGLITLNEELMCIYIMVRQGSKMRKQKINLKTKRDIHLIRHSKILNEQNLLHFTTEQEIKALK